MWFLGLQKEVSMSWTHILLLIAIAVLLFGPHKLPAIGFSIGEAIRGFKKGLSGQEDPHPIREVQEPTQESPQNSSQTNDKQRQS